MHWDSYSTNTGVFFLVVKRPWRKTENCPPSSEEVLSTNIAIYPSPYMPSLIVKKKCYFYLRKGAVSHIIFLACIPGISLNFLTHYIRIFLPENGFFFFLAKSIRNWTLYFANCLDNLVNHYRIESAVSDNRLLRGEPEDLVYIHQEPRCRLVNSTKSACTFQTNHNSFSCTHVKFSNLVFKRPTNFCSHNMFC